MNSEVRQPHRPGADDADWVVWLWRTAIEDTVLATANTF
jgi:hypothetical protein